jgi:uncharacterized membrane protein
MKKQLVVLVVTVAAAVLSSACLAKTYSLEGMRIDAFVEPDGSMRVSELVTYDFDGEFSYAYRDIPLKTGEELVGVGVGEAGIRYQLSDGGAPRTFSMSARRDGVRITWHYAARNEERTFEISYTLTGLVRRYPDTAEIYYKFVGEEWDRAIGRVDVEVHLPDSVEPSGIRAWAHGPLHGTLRILRSRVVALKVSPLPARTFWEARILCASEVFAGLPYADDRPRLGAIMEEETRWADEANRLRKDQAERREAALREEERRARSARGLVPVAIILGLAALGVWLMFYLRHGRPHPVVSHLAPGGIPSEHPPAIVSYLMYRTVGGPAVAATLLDLANRGYLEVRESATTTRGLFGKTKVRMDYRFDVVAKPQSDLAPFEQDLLRFVLTEAGDETGFSILELRKAASKHARAFRRFFLAWSKGIAEHCKSFHFFEPYPVRAMVGNAVCGAGVMGAGIAMSVLSEPVAGIPAMIAGGVQAVLTTVLTRQTAEGRRLMLAWKAFKSHLKALSRSMGPVTLGSPEWGRYLAAAVVFGIHEKVMPNLRMDGGRDGGVYPVWFYGALGSGGDGGVSGLASGLSAMVGAVSTTASSAAGAGGGASGGGGGGSGGGGGGAG